MIPLSYGFTEYRHRVPYSLARPAHPVTRDTHTPHSAENLVFFPQSACCITTHFTVVKPEGGLPSVYFLLLSRVTHCSAATEPHREYYRPGSAAAQRPVEPGKEPAAGCAAATRKTRARSRSNGQPLLISTARAAPCPSVARTARYPQDTCPLGVVS